MSNFTQRMPFNNHLFKAEEIYDPIFASHFALIIHLVCLLAISLTSLLLYIIVTKTPPFMANLKIYLIPYCIYSIILEAVWAIYTPLMLHPFVYFYPAGPAKYFPPILLPIIVAFGATAAISLLDCCIGVILERAFVLKNIEKVLAGLATIHIPYLNMNVEFWIPVAVFGISTFSCFLCFFSALVVIFIPALFDIFLVASDKIPNLINSQIYGLDRILNLNSLLAFQGADKNSIPVFIVFIGIFGSFRVLAAPLIIHYNSYKSYKLKNLMSAETKSRNLQLLKMCYLQFSGFIFFLFLPIFILTMIFWFSKTPNIYVNYCFVVMVCFSIYDTVITIFCIHPYRTFVVSLFKAVILRQRPKEITVMIQSLGS